MRFLLDTNVISDLVRGDANVAGRFKSVLPDDVAVSTVTVMEIEYGLALQPSRVRTIGPLLHAVLQSVHVLAFSRADAQSTGTVRAALHKKGRPIGPYDVMIAGCALSRGLTLVTANLKEFTRVQALSVESWR